MQVVPSPSFTHIMTTSSTAPAPPTDGPALSSGIICLKPAPLGQTLPNIASASALIADPHISVPREIVAGLLHAGTKGVLASGSKAGKTWVLLDLATSIATGTPFLKWPTTTGKVLFINLEIHRAFIKRRLEVIKDRKHLSNLDNLSIWTLRGQGADVETLLEDIIKQIQDEKYVLIVLDPIYKLMVGRSENGAAGVGMLCHQIERLVEQTGVAVVYAHHFTKGSASKKKAIDRMSGSGVFARDADTIMTLTEHKEEECYAVELTLRNFPPQPPFVVQWDFPIFVERPDLDPADLKLGEGEEAEDELEPLLALLDENPLTTGDWQGAAEAEGYSRPTFFRKKLRLEEAGRVEFNRKDKTWARAGVVGAAAAGLARAGSDAAHVETSETFDTTEAPQTNTAGQKVSSLAINPNQPA